MTPPTEPHALTLPSGLPRLIAATRPPFLVVTLIACLLGVAAAHADGVALNPSLAVVGTALALMAHAAANVINDYHDALSGCDEANVERVYPFTGGSRFIQNGVLSAAQMARLGYGLLCAVALAGMGIAHVVGAGLWLIGAVGLLLGWAYSAPPLKLQSRGLGELAIAGAWLLVVVGADYVQRREFAVLPLLAGLPFALLVANILFINQFPDRVADARAGKYTVVVRLGPQRARWLYPLLLALAASSVLVAIGAGALPIWAAVAVLGLLPGVPATRTLLAHATKPALLAPALPQTIATAVAHGGLMVLVLGLA